jgi:type VI secretion system protein ImpA
MSLESETHSFLAPLDGDSPAGVDLEDTQTLAAFDSLRVFGNLKAADSKDSEPNWRSIRSQASAALATSKDLRVLAYWSAAVLHLEGWPGLSAGLRIAASWLEESFGAVYPRPDGQDIILRKNSLAYFADRVAFLDAARRTPLVRSKQFGSVSLRELAVANGELPAVDGEQVPTSDTLSAIFTAAPLDELLAIQQAIDVSAGSLVQISDAMRAFGGSDAVPALGSLEKLVSQAKEVVETHFATRASDSTPDGGGDTSAAGGGVGHSPPGNIRTRDDAIRSLDAVSAFFRDKEPSSPVPLLVERAKRLIGKNFLQVLEEVVPAALAQAKEASGVKDPPVD